MTDACHNRLGVKAPRVHVPGARGDDAWDGDATLANMAEASNGAFAG